MSTYMLPKEYLSASSISTLLRCPKQFEFRYIHGVINPPTAALLTGTAMHSTLELYYGTVIRGREAGVEDARLPIAEVVEYTAEALDAAVLDAREKADLDFGVTERDEALANLSSLATAYVENVGKYITPRAVEEETNYTSRCGVKIRGYIDLVRELPRDVSSGDETSAPETQSAPKLGICDYKVTTKKWNLDQLTNSLQFNLYALMTGLGDIEIHNMTKGVKQTKKLPPKPTAEAETGVRDIANNLRTLRHVFDGSDFDHLETMIERCAALITSGIFVPCNPESWCCSPAWCGYWNLCRGAGGNARTFDFGA